MPVTNDGPIISSPKPNDDGPVITPPPPPPPKPPSPPPSIDEDYSVSIGNYFTLKDGIAASNECESSGDEIKCPAASAINYKGELDSVQQSDWVAAS